MQYCFAGNHFTSIAEMVVSDVTLEISKGWVKDWPMYDDAHVFQREHAAYSIMARAGYGSTEVSPSVLREIARLYPGAAEDARQDYIEMKYDI